MTKTKCATCGKKAAAIIGDCRFCEQKFCLKHRLPESHACINLENCKNEAKERNTENVMNGKCVSAKV